MSCERVQVLMGVPAELDRAERLLLSRHLQDCAACRDAMLQEERVRAHMAGLRELPLPARLQARLLSIPNAAEARPAAAMGRWLLALGLLAGFLVTAGWLLDRPGRTPAPVPAAVKAPAFGSPEAGDPKAPAATDTASAAGDRQQAVSAGAVIDEAGRGIKNGGQASAAGSTPRPEPKPGGAGSRPVAPDSRAGRATPDAGDSGVAPAATLPPAENSPEQRPPEQPRRQRTPALPTAAPLPQQPSSTPPTCIEVSFEAFLDLAGDGGRGCPGCDGRFDAADADAALAAGLTLPGAAVFWFDANGEIFKESDPMIGNGAIARLGNRTLCGAMPFTVGVSIGLPETLAFCPVTPPRQDLTPEDSGRTVRWAIGLPQCPLATPTPPSASQETPMASDPPTVASPTVPEEPGQGEPPPLGTAAIQGRSATPDRPGAIARIRTLHVTPLQAWYPTIT